MTYLKIRGFKLEYLLIVYSIVIALLMSVSVLLYALEMDRLYRQFNAISENFYLYRAEMKFYHQTLREYRKEKMPNEPHLIEQNKDDEVQDLKIESNE